MSVRADTKIDLVDINTEEIEKLKRRLDLMSFLYFIICISFLIHLVR